MDIFTFNERVVFGLRLNNWLRFINPLAACSTSLESGTGIQYPYFTIDHFTEHEPTAFRTLTAIKATLKWYQIKDEHNISYDMKTDTRPV